MYMYRILLFIAVTVVAITPTASLSAVLLQDSSISLRVLPHHARADKPRDQSARDRAALLYYIMNFVEWKDKKLADTPHLQICILGKDRLNEHLPEFIKSKKINDKPLRVSFFPTYESLLAAHTCHMTFIGEEENNTNAKTANIVSKLSIFTVCAVPCIAWNTCTVQLYEEKGKARIAVDLKIAEKSNVLVSAELLDIATVNK